jgi:hypothetical protein
MVILFRHAATKLMDTPKQKAGRPPTGRTKIKVAATIDIKVVAKIKKLANKANRSFSSILEELAMIALENKAKP